MARRFQDGIVNALSAGNVPEAATMADDLYRFLRELRERVDSAIALGADAAQPIRLQSLRMIWSRLSTTKTGAGIAAGGKTTSRLFGGSRTAASRPP